MLSGLRCQNCVARVRLGPRHDEPGRGRATDTTVSGAQCESNSGHDNSVRRLILCSSVNIVILSTGYWTILDSLDVKIKIFSSYCQQYQHGEKQSAVTGSAILV